MSKLFSGHATMVGEKTGKCVKFGVKSKDCFKCSTGKPSINHDCRKNFEGSSKAMESALAIDMLRDLQETGCHIKTITMDDDSTTICRIREQVNQSVDKKSDKNHVRKNISNDLYKLQQRHKSSLTQKVIDYLILDVQYALSQNQGNEEDLRQTLKAIVPHAYGEHTHCNSNWCRYLQDPSVYEHHHIDRDLQDLKLRKDLDDLFAQYVCNASKLSRLGSSQKNEALNQVISTKAPKAKHFGGSESLCFRVAAATAQANEGRSYVMQVGSYLILLCFFIISKIMYIVYKIWSESIYSY